MQVWGYDIDSSSQDFDLEPNYMERDREGTVHALYCTVIAKCMVLELVTVAIPFLASWFWDLCVWGGCTDPGRLWSTVFRRDPGHFCYSIHPVPR